MKKLFILSAFILIIFSSCEDKIDVDALTNYPPSILSVTPKTSTKIGDFRIKVVLADGTKSPLSSATITLKDASGTELYTMTKTLSGTMDSVVVEGSVFNAASLDYGTYTLIVKAVDTQNQVKESTTTFDIVDQLYPANNSKMFIAGAFNSWGADELELVAANTWEIKNVDLKGGEFKLKNTPDWTDQDWGDSDCNGVMEITTGGGPNTNCNYSGLVNLRFNDETLKYTITSAVTFATDLKGLYLLGDVNNYQGTKYKFTLVSDHTWELEEIRLKKGNEFKLSEDANFNGKNFGDPEFDGKMAEQTGFTTLPDSFEDAFYKMTFNDETKKYEMIFLRYPYPSSLYLVGNSSSADWNPANSIKFVNTGDGKFEIYAYLTATGDGVKFLQVQDWAGDWGKGDDGKLLQEGESNITVGSDGFYRILVNFVDGTYSVQSMDWGIVGSARTGDDTGWNADDNMAFEGGLGSYKWTITTTLFDGLLKFRANDGWDVNFGDDGGDGTLEYGGSNINITAGSYVIEMTLDPINGYTYTITPN